MERAKLWAGILLCLLVIGLMPMQVWIHFSTLETVQVVVQDKERITSGHNNATSKYLIFTETETFENTDSWLALKFNSSDVYGSIQKGQACSFRVTGYRSPFFSRYRNILSATCS